MPDPTTLETQAMPGSEQTSTEIVARTSHHVEVMPLITHGEIEQTWRVANALAKARMFKDVHQAEQAFAKILIGRDLGLSPTQSMQGLHVFDGNVQIAGPMLGSFIKRRRDEGYGYRVLQRTHEAARILFITPDGTDEDVAEFTVADAQRAGLTGKKNWKNDPRSMLFWRAMSNGVKAFCPEIMGGIPVYVEGEIPEPLRVEQPAGTGNDEPAIPHGLQRLLERAWEIDRRTFRRNEVAARLDGTEETFEAICGEVSRWIAANEAGAGPQDPAPIADAEVVSDVPVDDLERLQEQRRDLLAALDENPDDEALTVDLAQVDERIAALTPEAAAAAEG